jgi:hypothetical protein
MKKQEEKPNFEQLARIILGNHTVYGRYDAPIGSSERSYYETELKGVITGMTEIWNNYILPLQKEIDNITE